MNSRSIRRKWARKLRNAVFGGGILTLGVLTSCDPETANIVLGGLQGLSEALLEAFFNSIGPEGTGTTTGSNDTADETSARAIMAAWDYLRA